MGDYIMPLNLHKIIREHLESITDIHQKIHALNQLKKTINSLSPFKNEPTDCVLWIESKKLKQIITTLMLWHP